MLARWLSLVLLVLFGAYQALCFVETYRDTAKMGKLLPPDISWPAGWRMFTLLDTWNTRLEFQGWDGEAWVRLPMERWFPAHWDSGHRWERSAGDALVLRAFLAEACERAPVTKARVVEMRWERTPGLVLQPENHRKETVRATWTCGSKKPTVRGKVL